MVRNESKKKKKELFQHLYQEQVESVKKISTAGCAESVVERKKRNVCARIHIFVCWF